MDPTNRLTPRSRILRWVRRIIGAGAILLALLALTGALYQWASTRRFERANPPPGELVDVGGHRLHIHRRGTGSPAVIIDAGLSAASWEYESLADKLVDLTEVCTYDRAGYGWSDPGPRPRTSQQAVTELRALLHNAGVKPPYLLIGHSWGGLNMRLYASLHPDEVAGLVLLDSVNLDLNQETNTFGQTPLLYDLLDRTACLGTARLALPFILGPSLGHKREPDWLRFKFDSMGRTKTLHAIHDELSGQANWLMVRAAMKHLGDLPVTVVSRRVEKEDSGFDRYWFRSQQALTNISMRCQFIVAQTKLHDLADDTNHIEAIRAMVKSLRSNPAGEPGTRSP